MAGSDEPVDDRMAWLRLCPGVYRSSNERFWIRQREGHQEWWLTDKVTGSKKKFERLWMAQKHAESIIVELVAAHQASVVTRPHKK